MIEWNSLFVCSGCYALVVGRRSGVDFQECFIKWLPVLVSLLLSLVHPPPHPTINTVGITLLMERERETTESDNKKIMLEYHTNKTEKVQNKTTPPKKRGDFMIIKLLLPPALICICVRYIHNGEGRRHHHHSDKGGRTEGDYIFHSFFFLFFFLNFEFDWFTFIASLNPAAAATTGEELRSDLSRQKATREGESCTLLLISISFSLVATL